MINIARREICITLRRAGWRKSRHAHTWRDPTGKIFSSTNAAWTAFNQERNQ